MSELTVRRFEAGDGEQVHRLNEVAMAETPEWVPGAPDADLADVPGHYLDAGGEFLVGEREGEIVATAAYEPLDGWMAAEFDSAAAGRAAPVELSRMRVHPDCWGRGYGTRIYEAIESRARDRDVAGFVLNTGVDNDRARGFYEARGFDHVKNERVTFDDEVTLDLALYWKSLAPAGEC